MTTDRPRLGSLGWRLLLAFAVVALGAIALVVAAALVGTGRGIEQVAESERARVVARVIDAAAESYRAAGGWKGADLSEAEAIASGAGARLVVVAPDGSVVVGASGALPGSAATPAALPAALVAVPVAASHGPSPGPRSSGSGAAPRTPTATGRSPQGSVTPSPASPGPTAAPSTSAASPAPTAPEAEPEQRAPVVVGGTAVGALGLVFTDPVATARDIAWHWILAAAGVSLALAVTVGLLVTRRIARPLLAVAGAARAFSAGDRSARTGVSGPGEIGTVARSVDDMAEAVVRSEGSQRRMAANVAHELRTPLAALQLGLEEVRDGLVEPDTELVTGLYDQSLRLGRIVDDLAALSSAEATSFRSHRTEVDLAALATSEAAAQEPLLRAAGLVLSVDAPAQVPVSGDADRLRQVVANLLSNCARYCREGDAVLLVVERADGVARLVVRDNGPGISRTDLSHVFDRFWRGTSGRDAPGLGLGLAVVRELVTAHDGTVRVDSDGSSGTEVTVDLPLRP